jgi:ferredoxin-type protein NapG
MCRAVFLEGLSYIAFSYCLLGVDPLMGNDEVMGRREFFRKSFSFFAERPAEKIEGGKNTKGLSVIRPPGAVDEAEFLSLCTKCDDCMNACPHGSIKKAGSKFGSADNTPVIIPSEKPCYLCDDFPCIEACKTKALVSVADKREVRMGKAYIDSTLCYNEGENSGKMYPLCVLKCPLSGEAISMEDSKPVVDQEKCVGCGVCESTCLAINNQVAIRVRR